MATWNSKFPWLDQKYVMEIEQRTANVPAWAKEMLQQRMYSDFYAQQQREKEQQERLSIKNQLAQKELEAKWEEKKSLKLQQKIWNLADAIRNFYKMNVSDWDDDTIVSKFTDWIKNWNKMYIDYLNGDNNNIMIQTWLLWDTAKKLYNLPWNRLNPNSSNQNVTSTAIEAQKGNQPTATLSSTSHFDDPEYAAYYIQNAPEDYKQFIEESRKAGKDDTWIASVIDGYQVYTDKLQKYEDFENRPLPDRWQEIAVGIPQGFVNFFANAYNNLFANNPSIWLTHGRNIDMDKIQFTDELLGAGNNYGDLRAESWWTKTWEFGGEMWANLLLFHYLPMPWEWVQMESLAESALESWTKWVLKNIGDRMIYGAGEWAIFGELASMGQENVTWTDVAKNTALWGGLWSVFWLLWAGGNAWKYRNTLKTLAKEWDKEWTIKGLLDMYNRWVKPTSQWVKTNTQLQQYNDDAMWAVESIIKNKDALKYIDANWEETFGHLPRSLDEFSQAIKQTKQSIYDRYAAIAKEAWQTTNVDTSDIVTALKKQLKDKEWRAGQSEATIGKMEKWIKDLEELNNTMSVEWAQAKVQELNQKIQAFLKSQNPNDVSPNAVDGLVLNGLKKWIDDAIEKAGLDSEEYMQLRNMYRQLKSIESDVNHRAVVYGRQNPQSLVDSMSDLQTIDAIADIFSNPVWWTVKLLKTKAFKLAAKDRNNSNKIVENMFKDADDTISKTNTLKSQTQIANERTQRQQYNIRKSRQQRLEEANYRRAEMERAKQEIAEKQAQQEQEYQNYLKFRESLEKPDRPWLWYNEWFNWEPTTTIIWTPEWTNIRSWRWEIAETPTKNVNYPAPTKDLAQVRERAYKNIDNVIEKAKSDGLEPWTAEYDKVVWDELYKEFEDSFDDLLNEHMSNPEKHPNLIDPDELRYLVDNKQTLPAWITHPIVKELAERQYKRVVSELMKSWKKNALVMGWWSWAWKWFVRNHYELADKWFTDWRPADIIVDKVSWVEEANELVKKWFDVQQYWVIPRAENVVLNISQRAFEKGRWLSIPKVWREAHLRFVDQFLNWRPNKWALSPLELYANSLNWDWKYTLKLLWLKDRLVEVPNGKWSTKYVPEEWWKWAVEIPMSERRKALEDYEKEIWVELSNDKIEKVVKEKFLDTWKIDKSRYKELVTWISWLLLLWLANLWMEKEEA